MGEGAWLNEQPRVAPAGWGRGCVSGFYDPVTNAHYYYQAGDSNPNGNVWVYRYGTGPGGAPD